MNAGVGLNALNRIDFRSLFGALPSPYMILDRDLRYVEVNAAYLQVLEREREDLIGRTVFEAFPDPGEGGRLLRASLERVLETGQPHSLALIPYVIERPKSRGGGMELRYWSAVHTPLLDDGGEVIFIVQNTVDVTEVQRLRDVAFGPGAPVEPGPAAVEAQLVQRAAEVQRMNAALLEESTTLRQLFMQAPGFVAVLTGEDLTFTFVNQAYQQLIGHRPVVGKSLLDALPELAGQEYERLLRKVVASGEPFVGRSMGARLQRTEDAALEERFVDFVYQPIRDVEGQVLGVFVEGSDVTDRVRAERQQALLVAELNHRVKNALATVQSIAAQTLRTSPDPAAFRIAFESRLMALAATHDLLTASSWRGAQLRDVLLVELEPHGPERYELDGPDVALGPNQALSLGLVFHELATNAAKYGALSTPHGCVRVSWRTVEAANGQALELAWTERGGPAVTPPARRGFGSRLIERSLQGEIGGSATLEFAEGGVVCRVMAPLPVEPEPL